MVICISAWKSDILKYQEIKLCVSNIRFLALRVFYEIYLKAMISPRDHRTILTEATQRTRRHNSTPWGQLVVQRLMQCFQIRSSGSNSPSTFCLKQKCGLSGREVGWRREKKKNTDQLHIPEDWFGNLRVKDIFVTWRLTPRKALI